MRDVVVAALKVYLDRERDCVRAEAKPKRDKEAAK